MSKFEPLVRSYEYHPAHPDLIREVMRARPGLTEKGALAFLEEDERRCESWVNSTYQVQVRRYKATEPGQTGLVHLNIRRRDGKAIFRDWRVFQEIKNQLVGPEFEGVELYPAESRVVDTSNKYHLYVIDDPTFRFPFGWQKRDVVDATATDANGLKQRPLTTEQLK
jgi:hypothetical protein